MPFNFIKYGKKRINLDQVAFMIEKGTRAPRGWEITLRGEGGGNKECGIYLVGGVDEREPRVGGGG
jgi:hypothetical protein